MIQLRKPIFVVLTNEERSSKRTKSRKCYADPSLCVILVA